MSIEEEDTAGGGDAQSGSYGEGKNEGSKPSGEGMAGVEKQADTSSDFEMKDTLINAFEEARIDVDSDSGSDVEMRQPLEALQ